MVRFKSIQIFPSDNYRTYSKPYQIQYSKEKHLGNREGTCQAQLGRHLIGLKVVKCKDHYITIQVIRSCCFQIFNALGQFSNIAFLLLTQMYSHLNMSFLMWKTNKKFSHLGEQLPAITDKCICKNCYFLYPPPLFSNIVTGAS